MTNRLARGSAPGRARPEYLRPGSFKPGHKKRGGRKRGTPNLFSADYKKAILEAAYRIGHDGNGEDGVLGYFLWVGERHPGMFYSLLWVNLLQPEAESDAPTEPRRSIEELDQCVRDYIGFTGNSPTKEQTVGVESWSLPDWTGQPFPVGSLMGLAVEKPKAFCKLFVAAFMQPPSKRRRPAAPSWAQAGAA
jgi:hypothetical protein